MAMSAGFWASAFGAETLPPLVNDKAPQTFAELWAGYDPTAEPLETETLKEWEEDGVILRVLRYRVGIFKGQKAMMAAVYGFPKGGSRLPGLVQIHGGGQSANHRAPLTNAKRGYATISLAWAGRISAPGYTVGAKEVALFWEVAVSDPAYKLTTDWGALDAYHAPCRYPKNNFRTTLPAAWTLDAVESPRNNPWFLCTLAARRALTFLAAQPEVDAHRLGVYGHSMGGKLTVLTAAADPRVKAAAPSCGGVSDRYRPQDALYHATLSDAENLRRVSCPIIFLSPANDFHGRIADLRTALREIASPAWRVTSSPHHNHQDTPEYQAAGLLWFDHHLRECFRYPQTPEVTLELSTGAGYYYSVYTASAFEVSSPLLVAAPAELSTAHIRPVLKPTPMIEPFEEGWEKGWYSYQPTGWEYRTHKVFDPQWAAPPGAELVIDVRCELPNTLVVRIDEHAASVRVAGGSDWQAVRLRPSDFVNASGVPLEGWAGIRELSLSAAENLRVAVNGKQTTRRVGGEWQGPKPEFRQLRWGKAPTAMSTR